MPVNTGTSEDLAENRTFTYEIEQAIKAYNEGKMDIIVLYKAASVNKEKCPPAIRNYGFHTGMKSTQYFPYTHIDWDYGKVKAAFSSL